MEVKSTDYCRLIDRYRDGELQPHLRSGFEAHLGECPSCRGTIALLNNLVRILHPAQPPVPPAMPEKIARQAFQRARNWDTMVISWLRPAPAWIAVAVSIAFITFLWISPMIQTQDVYSEYESLLSEPLSVSAPQIQSPEDLASWLQEGGAQ
jgi:anti-sigma factor RsiW